MKRTTLESWAKHLNEDMFPTLTDKPMKMELVRFGLAVMHDVELQKELVSYIEDGKIKEK